MAVQSRKSAIGQFGENLAAKHLASHGIKIIGRNIRTRYGEIDIVGLAGECVVFVEVRTRTTEELGFPEDSINARKRSHMLSAAEAYMQNNQELKNDWRIDVIAIQLKSKSEPQIEWFQNAIS